MSILFLQIDLPEIISWNFNWKISILFFDKIYLLVRDFCNHYFFYQWNIFQFELLKKEEYFWDHYSQ